MKKVIPPASSSNPITYTWYLRDASGNIMATETHDGTPHFESNPLALNIEYPLYGSSRIGVKNYELLIQETQADDNTYYLIDDNVIENAFTRELNLKNYELSNHLGNVLVTISDRKIGHDGGSGIADYYLADVTSAQDYYPFGMVMPGRSFSTPEYRFGFNGQEKVDEVAEGHTTAEFWEYDSRIGRRWEIDPIDFADISPYSTFFNNPIQFSDPLGLTGEDENNCSGGAEGEGEGVNTLPTITVVDNKIEKVKEPQVLVTLKLVEKPPTKWQKIKGWLNSKIGFIEKLKDKIGGKETYEFGIEWVSDDGVTRIPGNDLPPPAKKTIKLNIDDLQALATLFEGANALAEATEQMNKMQRVVSWDEYSSMMKGKVNVKGSGMHNRVKKQLYDQYKSMTESHNLYIQKQAALILPKAGLNNIIQSTINNFVWDVSATPYNPQLEVKVETYDTIYEYHNIYTDQSGTTHKIPWKIIYRDGEKVDSVNKGFE